MPAARFVVFGEALTDLIREGEDRWRSVPGGSCWNVARAAARLGIPTGYAGSVSEDLFGEAHMRLSREAGLDLRFTQQLRKPPFLAMVWSSHPPQYFFIGEDSADLNFDMARLPAGWLDEVEIVHFGCISLVREPHASRLVAMAERVHAAGKRICFDPNYRNLMTEAFRPRLERLAGLADYIKASEEDLGLMFPGADLARGVAELRRLAPRAQLLVTLGAEGMRLITPEREVVQPAFPVELADTVGAGDSSMAAWMASLLTRPSAPPEEHVRLAAATAALVCSRHGAYAPTRAEVDELLRR
jgi:fructokinase